MSETVDVVVLGGGTGGYVAAIRGAQLGLNVVLVESSKLGGTCLHVGCIPTKALLRSAEVFATMQDGEKYGVLADGIRFDLAKAMARKQQIVGQLEKGIEFLMKKNQIRVIEGFGRVMGRSIFSPTAGAVRVMRADGEEEMITPRYTIIATGSKPRELPGMPFDGTHVLSSDDILALETLPASIIIVGGGAIGIEWASLLADVGVKVTVVEALSRILFNEDEEISSEMTRVMKKRGIKVMTNARVQAEGFAVDGQAVTLPVEVNGRTENLSADKVLVAIGRAANVSDIGLEATNVQVERGVIVVDDEMRTAEKNIYAIGDVIGRLQLAHAAAHEGIVAMESIAGLKPEPMNYDHVARATYSRPEVASIGLTEAQAKDKGYSVKTGKFPFRAIGKALVYGEVDGFVKIVADAEREDVLGVHMMGPHVTDLISEGALAQVLNATPWEIGHTIHPHPTLSEALGEAALAVDGRAIHI